MNIENFITLVAALSALVVAIWTARSKATKDELESLRQTIIALQNENTRLQNRVRELEQRNELQDAASVCLEDKVKILENDKATMARHIHILEEDKTKMSSKIECLERDNTALRARIAELEKTK
jgi:chromosome segregation ATPase